MAVTTSNSARATRALDTIECLAFEDVSTQEVIEHVVDRIVAVIDTDAFFANPTDPHTGLSVGGFGVGSEVAEQACYPSWEHEFLIPDYNKFADLTAANPVGDLRQATGGKLGRSARYRTLNPLVNLHEELRATLTAGGLPWGKLQLNRHTGRHPFGDADLEFLRAVAPLAGAALRRALLREPAPTDRGRGPGVVLIDSTGLVLSTTAEADAWLDELSVAWRGYAPNIRVHPELLAMAVSTLAKPEARSYRMRLRTPGGCWLLAHASPMAGSDQVAIVIEAARAVDIAPIIVDAYRLTDREDQVTRLLARGLSTDEIAATMCISHHTVRGYLKSIFDKVGVCSRGELTSKLFADTTVDLFGQQPPDAMLSA